MRNQKTFIALMAAAMVAASAGVAQALDVGDASAVNMKIYKMWVSPNTDCSDATLVYSEANPSYQNMIDNPTLGTGAIANGTYPCIAIKMSDVITGRPNYTSTSGNCTPTTDIVIDVFRSPSASTCPDDTTASGSGSDAVPAQDSPCLFMSTAGSDSNEGWRADSPFPLNGAFVVSGAVAGTFVADFRGKIEDAFGECGIQPPVFGFR